MELIKKYKNRLEMSMSSPFWIFILLEIFLIELLGVLDVVLKELNPFILLIFGILSAALIHNIRLEYLKPVLKIVGKEGPILCKLVSLSPYPPFYQYKSFRIIVKNEGRSAAEECKCYISNGSNFRICWMEHVEGQPSIQTINIEEKLSLDFCAFKRDVKDKIYCPTENGWKKNKREIHISQSIVECKVLVTSKNAKPLEAKVTIDRNKEDIKVQANATTPE
ncbi:MAG: hypothetical protein WAU66_04285 [Methanoregula sp.]|uniref:hypothetical protein n=1 Tax=Methanoregula sp. TaxID=2052170 RepID=UPI003BAEAC10